MSGSNNAKMRELSAVTKNCGMTTKMLWMPCYQSSARSPDRLRTVADQNHSGLPCQVSSASLSWLFIGVC
jgi:hypothetical protein